MSFGPDDYDRGFQSYCNGGLFDSTKSDLWKAGWSDAKIYIKRMTGS